METIRSTRRDGDILAGDKEIVLPIEVVNWLESLEPPVILEVYVHWVESRYVKRITVIDRENSGVHRWETDE